MARISFTQVARASPYSLSRRELGAPRSARCPVRGSDQDGGDDDDLRRIVRHHAHALSHDYVPDLSCRLLLVGAVMEISWTFAPFTSQMFTALELLAHSRSLLALDRLALIGGDLAQATGSHAARNWEREKAGRRGTDLVGRQTLSAPRSNQALACNSTTLGAARPSVTMTLKWRAQRSNAARFSSR